MKPLLFAIGVLIFSLSTSTLNHNDFDASQNAHFDEIQDENYKNQKLRIDNEMLVGFGCIDCHGSMDMAAADLVEMLKASYNSTLTVHQEVHPKFVEGLEAFLDANDEDQAWDKYIDYKKIEAIIEDQ